jgi:hypothetical protein
MDDTHSKSSGTTYRTAVRHTTVLLLRFRGLGFGLRNLRVAGVLAWCNGRRVGCGKRNYCVGAGLASLFMRGVKEYRTRDDNKGGVDEAVSGRGGPRVSCL